MLKTKLSKLITVTSLFLAVASTTLPAHAQPELKGSPEQLRQFLHPREDIVSLSSEAEKKAYSDQAIITLVVTTDKKKLSDSIANNSKLRAEISKKLQKSGLKSADIKNAKFSSSEEYGWFGDEPDSYKVNNRMSITIYNEKQLKAVAQISDQYKQAKISQTEFKHSKKESFKTLVKELALKKIMKLKAMYEKSLGVKLVAKNFRDNHIGYRPTRVSAMMMRSAPRKKSNVLSSAAMEMDMAQESVAQPTSFDEILYQANISVDFVVSTKK